MIQPERPWWDHGTQGSAFEAPAAPGVDGTSHGTWRVRYGGLPKTRLDHAYMACAPNLLRLEAYWTSMPLDRAK